MKIRIRTNETEAMSSVGTGKDPHVSMKSPHEIQDEFQVIQDDMTYRA